MAQQRTTINDLRPLVSQLNDKVRNDLLLHYRSTGPRRVYQLRERLEKDGEREISPFLYVGEMQAFLRGLLRNDRYLSWLPTEEGRPILEEGVEFQERLHPKDTIRVMNVYVLEDGETVVRVHDGCDRPDGGEKRSLAPEDIYERLDRGEIEVVSGA